MKMMNIAMIMIMMAVMIINDDNDDDGDDGNNDIGKQNILRRQIKIGREIQNDCHFN